MVNGVLRVVDVVEEDETHLLLRARDEVDAPFNIELLRGGARPEGVVRLLGALRHPALPVLVDRIELEGLGPALAYVGTPSVPGTALVDGVLPSVPGVLRLVERVSGALAAAHAVGVCHRDVCLRQIRLEASGAVRLGGWATAAAGSRPRRITFDAAAYLSPEALQRREGWASDVYALGVVLLELLAGQRLTPASVSTTRNGGLAALVRERAPDADPATVDGIVELVRSMVAEDAGARPLAMDVARRCQRLGAPLRGTDLARYAGDRVPNVLSARSPARGWAGRRLVQRASAPAPQLSFGWGLARA